MHCSAGRRHRSKVTPMHASKSKSALASPHYILRIYIRRGRATPISSKENSGIITGSTHIRGFAGTALTSRFHQGHTYSPRSCCPGRGVRQIGLDKSVTIKPFCRLLHVRTIDDMTLPNGVVYPCRQTHLYAGTAPSRRPFSAQALHYRRVKSAEDLSPRFALHTRTVCATCHTLCTKH